MTDWDDFRLEFDSDSTLHMRGRNGAQEALCAVCQEPIRWCLDMFTFTTGPDHTLAHARCVWTREGFWAQEALIFDPPTLVR